MLLPNTVSLPDVLRAIAFNHRFHGGWSEECARVRHLIGMGGAVDFLCRQLGYRMPVHLAVYTTSSHEHGMPARIEAFGPGDDDI